MDEIDEQLEIDVALTRLGLQMPQLIIVAIDEAEPGELIVRIAPFGFVHDRLNDGADIVDDAGGQPFILDLRPRRLGVRGFLVAFLLTHDLLQTQHLQFFVDGARSLRADILQQFQEWFPSVRIILDGFHLKKKCKEKWSLAMRGATLRNAALKELLPILWLGQVDRAIALVQSLPPDHIKSSADPQGLMGYFERNRPYIPCDALREALDLQNSSNPGDKANDLCVAVRQKHQGMSWSRNGSVALGTVTALHPHHEIRHAYEEHHLKVEWVA